MEGHAKAGASTARALTLMEIALGLSTGRGPNRPYRDVQVSVGLVQNGDFKAALTLANGSPDIAHAVARKEIDVAAINPSPYLTMAYRGTGLFPNPLPLRGLAVMPSWDRMAFAVADRTGITSLAQIKEQKYPLKLSIRESQSHATRFVVDEALAAAGFSLKDIESWGGSFHYTSSPSEDSRLDGIKNGTLDAVFDEGIKSWGRFALQNGMQFLELDGATQKRFEDLGWQLGPIPVAQFAGQRKEVMSPTFSGWPILTHADLPDEAAYLMCRALDEAKDRIPWDADGPVTLKDLAGGTDAAPLNVPLHPGAERYYRENVRL